MREIKFRVYHEDNSLMLYTGLKDKNGKEIYEGDIVKYRHEDYPEVDDVSGYIKYSTEDPEEETTRASFVVVENGKEEDLLATVYEVIGNIFENPELLKKTHS